jgi:hypothetical protein
VRRYRRLFCQQTNWCVLRASVSAVSSVTNVMIFSKHISSNGVLIYSRKDCVPNEGRLLALPVSPNISPHTSRPKEKNVSYMHHNMYMTRWSEMSLRTIIVYLTSGICPQRLTFVWCISFLWVFWDYRRWIRTSFCSGRRHPKIPWKSLRRGGGGRLVLELNGTRLLLVCVDDIYLFCEKVNIR